MKPATTLPILALFALAMAQAQVPGILNYQGRVTVGGTNLTTNAAKFKFALVNGDGTAVYWKNDGTTTTNEPSGAVTVPVEQGLHSTLLGDTNLANMAVVPSTVFTNPNVNLRTWFSAGGTNAFVQLSPDQRLGSSGYALRAAAADSFNGRTNFPTDTTTFSFVQNNGATGQTLIAGTNVVATFVQRPGAVITSCSIAYSFSGTVQGTVNFYDVTGLSISTIGTNSLVPGGAQTFTDGALPNAYKLYDLGGLNIASPAVLPRVVQIVINSSSGGSSAIKVYSVTIGFTAN